MSDHRVVLFVDIADSTRLYRTLGDAAARALVLQCLSLLEDVVAIHGGEVIDQIGDELMCTFPAAEAALRAATRMQEAMAPLDETRADVGGIAVRIGLHYGAVTLDGAKVFGDTVYTARRVASLAKAYQILTTDATVATLLPHHRFPLRFVDAAVLKGYQRPVEIHEVIWDPSRATRKRREERERSRPAVSLRCGATELRVDDARPSVKIGRSRGCDLRIDDPDVSQVHAQIECGRTAVMLTDVSTNGTYVSRHDEPQGTVVHRDTMPLTGAGIIGFGREPRAGDPAAVAYTCH